MKFNKNKKTTGGDSVNMAQFNVTLNEEILHQLFSGDNDGLVRLLEQVLNQILEAQRTEQLQADPYERNDQRKGYCNGYKLRTLATRVGRLTLMVPQIREGVFSTELFKRYLSCCHISIG